MHDSSLPLNEILRTLRCVREKKVKDDELILVPSISVSCGNMVSTILALEIPIQMCQFSMLQIGIADRIAMSQKVVELCFVRVSNKCS
jgi:hypothetical protein